MASDEDMGVTMLVSMWTMMGVAFLLLGLRFFCKKWYGKTTGADDYVLACSWVFGVTYSGLITRAVKSGLGKHMMEIPRTQIPETMKFIWFSNLFIIPAILASKTSFALTLLRIAERHLHRWLIWFSLATLYLSLGWFFILIFAQCRPISTFWNPSSHGKCWSPRIQAISATVAGAYSSLLDFLLASCPWLIIHNAQINQREKFGVIFAMSLGCLAGIASIVKTVNLPKLDSETDLTYQFSSILIWTIAEVAITIIAASIPFLRPLVKGSSRHRSNDFYVDSYQFESVTKQKATKNYNQSTAVWAGRKLDDGSDKSILGETGTNPDGIFRVVEYSVDHSRSGDLTDRGVDEIRGTQEGKVEEMDNR